MILQRNALSKRRNLKIPSGVSGMITVVVDKINKMAECGYPRLEVNEVGFARFLY